MDILTAIIEKSKGSIEALKASLDSKNFKDFVKAAYGVVKTMVFYMQQVAEALAEVGEVIEGKEKHESVKAALRETIVTIANDRIDIPFLSEEQERKLVFEPLIDLAIKVAVRKFKKTGWTLE